VVPGLLPLVELDQGVFGEGVGLEVFDRGAGDLPAVDEQPGVGPLEQNPVVEFGMAVDDVQFGPVGAL
jgi:hypothetical protein